MTTNTCKQRATEVRSVRLHTHMKMLFMFPCFHLQIFFSSNSWNPASYWLHRYWSRWWRLPWDYQSLAFYFYYTPCSTATLAQLEWLFLHLCICIDINHVSLIALPLFILCTLKLTVRFTTATGSLCVNMSLRSVMALVMHIPRVRGWGKTDKRIKKYGLWCLNCTA